MTDTELLERIIDKSGIKYMKLMEAANIKSYATFRSRMYNNTGFTASEIQAISDTLKLTAAQRDRVFFAKNVEPH